MPRPSISSRALAIGVAFYLAFICNQTFWAKAASNFEGQTGTLFGLRVGIFALFAVITISVSVKYAIKPLFIGLIMAASAGSWFMSAFGTILSVDIIQSTFETTQAEAASLLTPRFLMHMTLYGVIPSALIAALNIRHEDFPQKLKNNLLLIVPGLMVFGACAYFNAGALLFAGRSDPSFFRTLNPVVPINNTIRALVRSGHSATIVTAPLGTDATIARQGRPRILVVIAGETARAKSFSLGGYERDTNPQLAKHDTVYFSNVQSCGTLTSVSLPCMFSFYPQAEFSHTRGLDTENVLDVLGHAGVTTEWWDNNTGDKDVARRISFHPTDKTDPSLCLGGECHDEILLEPLNSWLDTREGDAVLVLHQLGSHGPSYYKRYPDKFRRFMPDCRSADFAQCSRDEIVNAYDNTILYTDHVIATAIEKLKAFDDRYDVALLYVSDHGESLGEYGLYLHGAPSIIAPAEQTHVPMTLWLGKGFAEEIDKECLLGQAAQPYSHDNVFHTLLGIMGVSTQVHDTSLDITHTCRKETLS